MAHYQWRKFQFFNDGTPQGDLPAELQKPLLCSSCDRSYLFFGAADGTVLVADRSLKLVASFSAHGHSVSHMQQLKQRNVLVTVGEDEAPPTGKTGVSVVKLWDIDKLVGEGGSVGGGPPCLKTIKVFTSKFPEAEISSFLVLEEAPPSLWAIIGLNSGQVYLLHGDFGRDRIVRTRLVVDPGEDDRPPSRVTGLTAASQGGTLYLFAATLDVFVSFNLTQSAPQRRELDAHGCQPHCLTMSDSSEPVLGRPEAVYFYEADGRGPCWAFEGEKRFLSWFRGYLLCVTAEPRDPLKNTITVYDLKNKLIAYSATVGAVQHVLSGGGMITVLTDDHKALCLAEKDMGSKLEMLFRKNLYTIAINLIQGQQADAASTADVMRKYGDHLYGKQDLDQDYDEAMAQYIRTIGQLEPSYVIQKFLDAQRIHNLTHYLEKLHERGLATADHTTLLLNCYTKLKDVAKLDQFIKAEGDHRFDVETAVRVCRAAGYYEHALWVAKRAGEHEWYLKILLEDLGRYEEALKYIGALATFEAAVTLKQYGKILVTHRPGETTGILLKLCTQGLAPAQGPFNQAPAPNGVPSTAGRGDPPAASSTASTSKPNAQGTAPGGEDDLEALLPSPMDFVHVFVDRPRWLLRFFEQYSEQVKGSASEVSINNTLLELYLADDLHSTAIAKAALSGPVPAPSGPEAEEAERERKERLKKALALLKAGWPPHEPEPKYDPDLAVVLCQMQGFREGRLFLYEKMRLYKEVIESYMAEGDHAGLIACCRRLGTASRGGDPNLWTDVLTYFGEKGGPDCEKEVREVLEVVERDRLLPPLIVLQKLARNPHLQLATVRDYVARQIAQDTRAIEEDRRAIEKYKEETAAMRAEVAELRSGARIFQNTKCTACTSALDLPAIHFLCMHSFHQRCLGENERECPVCAPANRTVLEMKKSLDQNSNDHDRFFQLVQNSDDGFSVIAEYFGRGILNRHPTPQSPMQQSSTRTLSQIPDLGQLVLT